MAKAVDFSNGIGRKELQLVRRRFRGIQRERLRRIEADLNTPQQDFLNLLRFRPRIVLQKSGNLEVLFVAQIEPHLESLGEIVGHGFPFSHTSINLELPRSMRRSSDMA